MMMAEKALHLLEKNRRRRFQQTIQEGSVSHLHGLRFFLFSVVDSKEVFSNYYCEFLQQLEINFNEFRKEWFSHNQNLFHWPLKSPRNHSGGRKRWFWRRQGATSSSTYASDTCLLGFKGAQKCHRILRSTREDNSIWREFSWMCVRMASFGRQDSNRKTQSTSFGEECVEGKPRKWFSNLNNNGICICTE